jgi:hypothetical protein
MIKNRSYLPGEQALGMEKSLISHNQPPSVQDQTNTIWHHQSAKVKEELSPARERLLPTNLTFLFISRKYLDLDK